MIIAQLRLSQHEVLDDRGQMTEILHWTGVSIDVQLERRRYCEITWARNDGAAMRSNASEVWSRKLLARQEMVAD
jgi:hypothetical protein